MGRVEMLAHVVASVARPLEHLPHVHATRVQVSQDAVVLRVWYDPDFDSWPVLSRVLADGVWPAGVCLEQLGGEDEGLIQFRVRWVL